jgi:pimeloyl-ACP methyl ester carboxylesterase
MPTDGAPVELTFSRLAGDETSARLLIVGPSLGTAVSPLWRECAEQFTGVEVLGWDLPGHGQSRPASGSFRVEDLAAAVRSRASETAGGRPVTYSGVSLGGVVGFALALEPGLIEGVVAIAAVPQMGIAYAGYWNGRASEARSVGTAPIVEGAASRWFTPDFAKRSPEIADELLASLADADNESYALACEALARFDPGENMSAARIPVHIAVGEHDHIVPQKPGMDVLAGCAHLPPPEDPRAVAAYLVEKGLAA